MLFAKLATVAWRNGIVNCFLSAPVLSIVVAIPDVIQNTKLSDEKLQPLAYKTQNIPKKKGILRTKGIAITVAILSERISLLLDSRDIEPRY